MGEGSVDQAVECRLMARVRRGAHDLDLEVFGNVTRIGVRDIQRRILFPDRVDGLGRFVLGQWNQVAAMVLRSRSIRIVCPAKERVAVTGRYAFVDIELASFRRSGRPNCPLGRTRSNVVEIMNQLVGILGGVGDFAVANCDGKARGFLIPGGVRLNIDLRSTALAIGISTIAIVVVIEGQLYSGRAFLRCGVIERQTRVAVVHVATSPAGNGIAGIRQDLRVAEFDSCRTGRVVLRNKFDCCSGAVAVDSRITRQALIDTCFAYILCNSIFRIVAQPYKLRGLLCRIQCYAIFHNGVFRCNCHRDDAEEHDQGEEQGNEFFGFLHVRSPSFKKATNLFFITSDLLLFYCLLLVVKAIYVENGCTIGFFRCCAPGGNSLRPTFWVDVFIFSLL